MAVLSVSWQKKGFHLGVKSFFVDVTKADRFSSVIFC